MDGNVVEMSLQERGAYITLLCLCWLEQQLPLELPRLAHRVGVSTKAFTKLWPAVGVCFTEVDGHLIHKRLDKERVKQAAFLADKASAGRWSVKGATRVGGRFAPRHQQPLVNTTNSPPTAHQQGHQQPTNSSISDLRSPISVQENSLLAEEALEAKAGRFCERFAELFYEHRYGAKYFKQPNLDWQRVCRLLTVWDAERLEKLAVLLLTTDDKWISTTDRNIAILEKKASFLDDLLRQWERAQETPV